MTRIPSLGADGDIVAARSSAPAVHVEGVIKRFGATVALAGVDLEVAEGRVFALLGPNGAGKTTLVRVLATLLAPDAGRAEVFGCEWCARPGRFASCSGSRGSSLPSMRSSADGRTCRCSAACSISRATRRDGGRPSCWSASSSPTLPTARRARTPEGCAAGWTSRRACSRVRGSCFSDEPTAGLDPRSRNEIWAIVRELVREGTTIMLTTQYLEEADQLADRIAVIDHGRVIAEGTANELKDRVGGQILEVELTSAAQRDEAQSVLAGVGCGDPEPGERLDRLTLPAPRDGLELIEDAASALRQAGIGVSDLGLRRPTLDDVFLQLTGAPPSEDGAGPDASASASAGRPPAVTSPASAPDHGAGRLLRAHRPSLRELRSAAADARVVTARNLRHFVRQPQLLIFSTIQPIMFVFLFVYVFGGAVEGSLPPGVTYVDFLLPGIFVQSVAFRATQTAVGLSEDLERGVIDRFRSMPMARSAVLIGRTVADLVRNVLIIALMTAVGYLIGFRFQAGLPNALACVAVVSAFGLALSWIFAFVALTVRGAEAAQSAGFVVLFPLVFASSVFVPVSTMPDWLQAFAEASPVTLTANAARSYTLDGGVPESLAGAAAWIIGLLVIFIPLCVWRYRRMS